MIAYHRADALRVAIAAASFSPEIGNYKPRRYYPVYCVEPEPWLKCNIAAIPSLPPTLNILSDLMVTCWDCLVIFASVKTVSTTGNFPSTH